MLDYREQQVSPPPQNSFRSFVKTLQRRSFRPDEIPGILDRWEETLAPLPITTQRSHSLEQDICFNCCIFFFYVSVVDTSPPNGGILLNKVADLGVLTSLSSTSGSSKRFCRSWRRFQNVCWRGHWTARLAWDWTSPGLGPGPGPPDLDLGLGLGFSDSLTRSEGINKMGGNSVKPSAWMGGHGHCIALDVSDG
jgi:hypothetical protein